MARLAQLLRPCGPVADDQAAGRIHESLSRAAESGGWKPLFEEAWPALAPVFGA